MMGNFKAAIECLLRVSPATCIAYIGSVVNKECGQVAEVGVTGKRSDALQAAVLEAIGNLTEGDAEVCPASRDPSA